jgi:hypothetical protein
VTLQTAPSLNNTSTSTDTSTNHPSHGSETIVTKAETSLSQKKRLRLLTAIRNAITQI